METNRPWLSAYPAGIPANIDPNAYPTLLDYLSSKFKEYKKRSAFSLMGKELTYGEVDTLSTQFGAYLTSRGLEPGDRIALMMPNLLQYPIALFGAFKAGLIVVNTNPLYTTREMKHQFNDSEVKGIVIAQNFASKLQEILPDTQIKVIVTTGIGDMLGMKGTLVNFTLKNVKRMIPKYDLPNEVKFAEALSQGKKFELPTFENLPDSVIVHQYTGGTTGVSKGAMLTNRNLVSNMLQMREFVNPYFEDVEGAHIVLDPLPLYHIFAFTVNCLAMMDLGGLSVLIVNPRDISSITKEFNRYKVTGMTGVNTLYNAMLNDQEFTKLDFSSIRFAAAGGTALQKAVADEWEKVTGSVISEGYGMTESSPVITINPKGLTRVGTVGIPVPSTEVIISDDDGNALPIGESGEIRCRGPQVMKGYYKRPDETANTITSDGWLCTGDIGVMDEKGYFKIVDRKKDMILVSGFNVYPNEIEDVIALHPKVMEVAAVGAPSEKSGECVKVFVVKKDKSLNEDELIRHCRENLTGYKVPKQVAFLDELPKSNVGKILRKELRGK